MQELTTERDKLYYSAACLFFSDNIWLGINAIVNSIGFDNEHEHVCNFLNACNVYLSQNLLKLDIYDKDESKLHELSNYDYGFTVVDTNHLYVTWSYVEESYKSSRSWDDNYEHGDYLKFTDSIRLRYEISLTNSVLEELSTIGLILYSYIEREGDIYSCTDAIFVSSHITITGNKAIVKMYGENMSKTLFKLFKNYINDEKDFLCPVSDNGHLCFCRQLRVCCCR